MIASKIFLLTTALAIGSLGIAQDTKGKKGDKGDKGEKTELQTIVITREGDNRAKVNIEIDGDEIRVNGKKAADQKDVNVSVTRIKDRDSWSGDWDDEGHRQAMKEHWKAMAEHKRSMAQQRRALADLHVQGQRLHLDADGDAFSFFSEDNNRAMLGVITDEDDKGAKVTSVTSESAAAKAGLKEGDIITHIGDKKVADADDVAEAVRSHKPGDKISITALRDGKEQKFTAELGKWKGFNLQGTVAPDVFINPPMPPMEPMAPMAPMEGFGTFGTTKSRPKLGLTVQDRDDRQGVDVLEVDKDGIADKAGIRKGDVIIKMNDKEVRSADGLRVYSLYNSAGNRSADVKMEIKRDGKSQMIEIKFPRQLKKVDL